MSRSVTGNVQPATPKGFAELIDRANEMAKDGLTLVGIVNLSGKQKLIAGVFVRLPEAPRTGNLV